MAGLGGQSQLNLKAWRKQVEGGNYRYGGGYLSWTGLIFG